MLPYRILGNKSGPTVIFIHGWPDTDKLFEPQYAAFQATHRIVTFSLPQYDLNLDAQLGGNRIGSWFLGDSLGTVADKFKEGIVEVMKDSQEEKPALIAHDWGACVSWELIDRYPELIGRFVALDIGPNAFHLMERKWMTRAFAILLWYQWTLILLWLLPRRVADPVIRSLAKAFKAPRPEEAHGGMGYLYLYTWVQFLTGTLPRSLTNSFKLKARSDGTTLPILFLRSNPKKSLQFFKPDFVDMLRKTEGCDEKTYDGDHWFFIRKSCKDEATKDMVEFVSKKSKL